MKRRSHADDPTEAVRRSPPAPGGPAASGASSRSRSSHHKIFLIIDNGPCHNLDEVGKEWLAANRHRIELFRLPP